ncbi:hypothetical protein ACFX12_004334 [Malus domestica]
MATESSEGEEDAKLMGGNQLLVVDDNLREMGKKAAWSVSSCKAGNGIRRCAASFGEHSIPEEMLQGMVVAGREVGGRRDGRRRGTTN